MQGEPVDNKVIFLDQHRYHDRGYGGGGWSGGSGPDDFYYDGGGGYGGYGPGGGQVMVYDDRDSHYYGNPPMNPYTSPPMNPNALRNPIDQGVENEEYNEEEGRKEEEEEDGESKHLQANQMYGIQKIRIEASISGTLNDLLSPSKTTFQIQKNNLKQLRINSRTTNRKNATNEDFSGDLSKTVILDVHLISTGSHYGVPIGVEYSGMNPQHLTTNNCYQHILKPLVPLNKENRSIWTPNSVFSANMYRSYGKCDMNSLNYQIKFEGSENEATVHTGGIVWDTIMDNIDCMKKWQSSVDDIYDANDRKHESRARSRRPSPWEVIPRYIATDVYNKIAKALKNIEKSFVNLEDFQVKFHRADGASSWNDIHGLIGQEVASDSRTQTNYKNYAINKQGYAFAEIELSYITYD